MSSLLNHKDQLLFLLGLTAIGIHALSYLYGFNSLFYWLWPAEMFSVFIGYVISILCVIVVINMVFKRNRFLRFIISWSVLTAIVAVPGYYSELGGALSAFYFAGPKQVFTEARSLIRNCQQSSDLRANCGYMSDIPPAIGHVHPQQVFVSDKFVVIGKLGFYHADGFMIFLDGDKPSEGMRVEQLSEGLYWTYGD